MKYLTTAVAAAMLVSLGSGAGAQNIAELRAQLAQTREMIRQAEAAGMDPALLQSLRQSMDIAEQSIREMEADQGGSSRTSGSGQLGQTPIQVNEVKPVYVNGRQRTAPAPAYQAPNIGAAKIRCFANSEVVVPLDCKPKQSPTAPAGQKRTGATGGKATGGNTGGSGKPHIIIYWGDSQSGNSVRVIDKPNAPAVAEQQIRAKGPGAWVKYLESSAPGYGAAMCKGELPNVHFYVVHGYATSKEAITAAQNEARAAGPGLTYLCSNAVWHLD